MNKKANNLFTGLIAILSLVSVALLWKKNFILTIVLIILAIFMLLMNKSKREIIVFVFFGFLGAGIEVSEIAFGVWRYNNPSFIGIPIWLIVLWGIASIFIIRVYSSFNN